MSEEIRQEDFASLASKLESLDLTSSEKILLNSIIENANEESEVAGFTIDKNSGLGYDNASWLLNQNITGVRVQVASKWSVGPIVPKG